jgi:hypothetical protein
MIAKWLGFSAVFMLAALFSMGAALVLLMAPELILPKKTSSAAVMRDHTPKSIDQ